MSASLERQRFAIDDESTRAYFDGRARSPADGYVAADWGSRLSQELRFAVLCEIGELAGASILDVGCGAGDLWRWLHVRGIACRYTGLDLSREMLARARAATEHAGVGGAASGCAESGRTLDALSTASVAELREGSVLDLEGDAPERYDWVIASGLFYRRAHAPELYFQRAVAAMLRVARRGVALNSLSTWGGASEPNEWRADPSHLLQLVRGLGARIVLRHDYHVGDCTLYLRKHEPGRGEVRA